MNQQIMWISCWCHLCPLLAVWKSDIKICHVHTERHEIICKFFGLSFFFCNFLPTLFFQFIYIIQKVLRLLSGVMLHVSHKLKELLFGVLNCRAFKISTLKLSLFQRHKTNFFWFYRKVIKQSLVLKDTNIKIYWCMKSDIGLRFASTNITFHTPINLDTGLFKHQ